MGDCPTGDRGSRGGRGAVLNCRELLNALEAAGVTHLNLDAENCEVSWMPLVSIKVELRAALKRYAWYLTGPVQGGRIVTMAEARKLVGIIRDDCRYIFQDEQP